MRSEQTRRWFRVGERAGVRPPVRFGYLARATIIAALVLVLVSKGNPGAVEPIRAAIAAPLAGAFSGSLAQGALAVQAVAQALGRVTGERTASGSDSGAGRTAAEVSAMVARIDRLEGENRALRALLPVAGTRDYKARAVAVIGGGTGAMSSTLLIAAGRDHGVKPGYPVVMGDRLAGRVHTVHASTAVVLRLSDRLSRVPVFVGAGGVRALLVGDGSGGAMLELLGPGSQPVEGDHVTTSGIGGVFPRGLLIGRISSAGEAGYRVAIDSEQAYEPMVGVLALEGAVFDFPGSAELGTDALSGPASLASRPTQSGPPAVASSPAKRTGGLP